MCFNAPASMFAFIIGAVFSAILFARKQYFYSIFSFNIVIIQLLEFFVHISLQTNNYVMNKISSMLIMFFIFLQPITYSLLLYFVPPKDVIFSNPQWKPMFISLAIIAFINFLCYFIYLYKNNKFHIGYLNKCSNVCRLDWSFLTSNWIFTGIYIFFYFVIFFNARFNVLSIKDNYLQRFFMYTLIVAFIFIFIIDKVKNLGNVVTSFGSLWCFLSVFYPMIMVFFGNNKN